MWTLRNPEDQTQALVAQAYQWDFATSKAAATLMSGGWGSGKSYAGLLYCSIAAQQSPPGSIGIAAQPNFPMMNEWLQSQLLPAFRDIIVHHSVKDRCLHLPGDRKLYYRSAHIPQNIQMTNAVWAYLDEPHIMRPQVWEHLVARVRKKVAPGKRLRVGLTSLPRVGWLSDEFDNAEYEGEGTDKRRILYAETAWNHHLDDGYSANIKSVTPSRMWPAYLGGRFVSLGGTVHDVFDPRMHIIPWQYRPTMTLKNGGRAASEVQYAIDWGINNPHVLFVQMVPALAQHPDGWWFDTDVHVAIDEIYPDGEHATITTERLCLEAKARAKSKGYRMTMAVGDTAGDNRQSTSGETDFIIARRVLGVPVMGMPQPKRSGIQTVNAMLDPVLSHPRLYFARSLVTSPYDANPKRRRRGIAHATQALSFKRGPDGRMTEEAEKDGVTDHATDAMRYFEWWHRRDARLIDVRQVV